MMSKRLAVATVSFCIAAASVAAEELRFSAACDASAAVLLDDGRLVVADDEDDVLRVYSATGGSPVRSVAMDGHLRQAKPKDEADLEGAARLGDRLYWLASHSRNNDGKPQPDRRRVFATDLDLLPVGEPGMRLLDGIGAFDDKWQLGLVAAIGDQAATVEGLAPEAAGFNIEGLAVVPPGHGGEAAVLALIGLRNPRTDDAAAIILGLRNLDDAATDNAAGAFGEPIRLDLGGRGIRDMAWSTAIGTLILVAGPIADETGFGLYRWSGAAGDSPTLLQTVDALRPEVLVLDPGGRSALLLSDDGDAMVAVASAADCTNERHFADGHCPCKRLEDDAAKSFRGRVVALD